MLARRALYKHPAMFMVNLRDEGQRHFMASNRLIRPEVRIARYFRTSSSFSPTGMNQPEKVD